MYYSYVFYSVDQNSKRKKRNVTIDTKFNQSNGMKRTFFGILILIYCLYKIKKGSEVVGNLINIQWDLISIGWFLKKKREKIQNKLWKMFINSWNLGINETRVSKRLLLPDHHYNANVRKIQI